MEFAKAFAQHSSRHFWVPVIKCGEDCKQKSAHESVVKVCHDKIRTTELPIERRTAQHDPGETSDQKLKQKCNTKQHGRLELDLPSPHGSEPVEDLDARWNTDSKRGQCEKAVSVRAHPYCEHVVRPHAHAQETDT